MFLVLRPPFLRPLEIQVRHRLVYGLRGLGGDGWSAGRLGDLEIDSRVILHADDAKEGSDGLGGIALAADDLAHVGWIDIEGEENAHLVHRSIDLYVVRILDQRFYQEVEEFRVSFYHVYCVTENKRAKSSHRI